MIEYIDKKPFLDKLLHMGYFDDSDEIREIADSFTITDVVKRAEYDELNKEYLKSIHSHTECLKELQKYKSNIDKTTEEITKLRDSSSRMVTKEATLVNECYKQYANCFDECLKIIKQNIGDYTK